MNRSFARKLNVSSLALCAGALVLAGVFVGPASAADDGAWFVVRHDKTGACWSAVLVKVDGEYAHAFAQVAGGPYKTKAEARAREAALEKEGVCTQ